MRIDASFLTSQIRSSDIPRYLTPLNHLSSSTALTISHHLNYSVLPPSPIFTFRYRMEEGPDSAQQTTSTVNEVDPAFLSKVLSRCSTYKAHTSSEKEKLQELRDGMSEVEKSEVAAVKQEMSKIAHAGTIQK